MKILMVSRGYPSAGDVQWGCFEKDQAIALMKLGHQVSIIYVDRRFRFRWKEFGMKRLSDNGITIYGLFLFPGVIISKISEKLFYWVYSRLLEKVFQKLKKETGFSPDVIYAHYLNNIWLSLAIKDRHGIPLIGIEHWSELGKERLTNKVLKMGNRAYPRIDKLIVVSSALQKNIFHFFNIESQVVNNIVGNEFNYRELTNHHDTLRFVSIGSLFPIKCFDLIIRGLSIVKTSKNYQLDIIGDGPEYKTLQTLINQYHLEDRIRLLGKKNRQEIVDILQNSDVYILASSSETFGVAAVEALACGIPVIATDCGGPRDFITPENGILIPTNDIEAMKQGIEYMMEHCQEYDRAKIAKDCHNRFSANAIAQQLSRIFEQVKDNSTK